MTKDSLSQSLFVAIFLTAIASITAAQAPPKIDPMMVPDIAVQDEDYAQACQWFHTTLLVKGPAPEQVCAPVKPPLGVSEIEFPSSFCLAPEGLGEPSARGQSA
jgi:hypothetical protein